jgi:hypothetical protein
MVFDIVVPKVLVLPHGMKVIQPPHRLLNDRRRASIRDTVSMGNDQVLRFPIIDDNIALRA